MIEDDEFLWFDEEGYGDDVEWEDEEKESEDESNFGI